MQCCAVIVPCKGVRSGYGGAIGGAMRRWREGCSSKASVGSIVIHIQFDQRGFGRVARAAEGGRQAASSNRGKYVQVRSEGVIKFSAVDS